MAFKLYKHRPNKDGIFQVRLSISITSKERKITTIGALSDNDFALLQKKIAGGRVPASGEVEKVFNLYTAIRSEVERLEIGIAGGFISSDDADILEIVNRCKGKEVKQNCVWSVDNIFLKYIADGEKLSNWADGTITQMMNLRRSVVSYCNEIDRLATMEGVEGFEKWMMKKGVSNTTIKQAIVRLRTFLRWCNNCGYCGSDFDRYKCKLKTADIKEKAVVFLTIEEMEQVRGLELDNVQKAVRDVFLFQCYTGLRFSDVIGLRWSDIKGDTMQITIQKTATHIINKLPTQAIELLDEYRGKKYAHNHIFPNYNNSTYNAHLRTIARDAGLCEPVTITEYRNGKRTTKQVQKWEKVTTHTGRKTFVVNSLSMGFTANQVIKYTGHSTTQALQPYIDITEEGKNAIADRWSEIAKKTK